MSGVSRSILLAATSLTMAGFAVGAHAEDAPRLEEITVTADRRDSFSSEFVQAGTFRNARLIDTPLTVNVVPRAVIDAQAASTILDALKNTAGVTRSQLNGGTYDNLSIRGIVVENRSNYRLNGSLPIINLVDLPLENKERVEVLKGVSALYYGFTPPSGIVNLTMKRATPGRDVTEATIFGNSNGGYGGHVDIGRRLGSNEEVGLRLNGVLASVETGVEEVGGWRALGSAAFDWDISDRLSFSFDLEHIRKNVSEQSTLGLPAAVNGVITLPARPDADTNLGASWMRYDAEATNALARINYRFSDAWALTVEAGQARTARQRNFSRFDLGNAATGEGSLNVSFVPNQVFRNRNARVELAGTFETGPLVHEVTFGATVNERTQHGTSLAAVNFAQNLYNPRPIARVTNKAPSPNDARTQDEINDKGAYVFNRIKWGEAVQFLAGVRFSDYSLFGTTTNYNRPSATVPSTSPCDKNGTRQSNVTSRCYEASPISPSFGLVVKPVSWLSVYGTYIEGLEEGGSAPADTINANEIMPPATSEQWEGGVKAELSDKLMVTAAYFRIDRPSAYTRFVTPGVPSSGKVFVQDGKTLYQGFEASISGEITSEWSVYASGLYLDAEQRNAADASIVGKRPENTPKYSGSLFAEYRPAFFEGFAVNGGVYYTGKRPVNASNQAFVDDFTLFNLGARYTAQFGERDVTFQVNAENITGKNYWNSAGNGLLGVGLPPVIKFQVRTSL